MLLGFVNESAMVGWLAIGCYAQELQSIIVVLLISAMTGYMWWLPCGRLLRWLTTGYCSNWLCKSTETRRWRREEEPCGKEIRCLFAEYTEAGKEWNEKQVAAKM